MTLPAFEPKIIVNNDKCTIEGNTLKSKYTYTSNLVTKNDSTNSYIVDTVKKDYEFNVDLNLPKLGIMLVGLGGNNGTTLLASVLANKNNLEFYSKNFKGLKKANYYGSVTQSSTIKLGIDPKTNDEIYVPFTDILPLSNPNDFVITGWDISDLNCFEAMQRACVLEHDLQMQLKDEMEKIKPLKSIYYPDFIALNQNERANHCFNRKSEAEGNKDPLSLDGLTKNKWSHVEQIRDDIRNFKKENNLDKVIVLWTANTERYSTIEAGVNDNADNLLNAIKNDHSEVSPSTIFAVASILEGVPYINGSPQNTFVPGVIDLAEREHSFIAGDDFKSGQTKMKSVLAQFLVDAGIKPLSIASYNHLGNNDGFNLSSPMQFKSKEISKRGVCDDMIESNQILFNDKVGKTIDHCIVIKYLNAVGDSKVAMDEYYSELMLGGHNRISIHNVCEDSLLATPLIIDLLVMTEFCTRVTYKKLGEGATDYEQFYPVLTLLSYWLKAPLTRPGFKPINGLMKQRAALENFLRLLIGLPPLDDLRFEERLI
ncbi:hypothetical protein TPHA_0A02880 [Tetrapisispora phaffii CBS 4417]|uniref:Inositol-3-phosphate synthase n=1 Tax=Tetrapisispora phaffii (strain ATCC 24235 / CBS 4417 / NBRC 1672 / NRRL Y-8282 / UCD 70-5) TaxID=1071381 RepID=G8BN91_TETPH|nr:hypothetical protein TPHA_0A02880 [Tetrapisispora phaffii CBS 4417]CCE61369.1 hypothetical protein TPHA_0A02880 [Tetrapisispora phaffii CBS 4417]